MAKYEDDTQIGSVSKAFEIKRKAITPTLTATGVTKIYDGDTEVKGDIQPKLAFTGTINSEIPVATAVYNYDTKDVGTGKTINATAIVLKPDSENLVNSNYTLSIDKISAVGAVVTKAIPLVTAPTDLHAITNTQKTLADVKFTQPTDGVWTWNAPKTELTASNDSKTQTFKATFTPKDSKNYDKAEKYVTIDVSEVVATFESLDIKIITDELGTTEISATIKVIGAPLPTEGNITLDKVVTWSNSCPKIVSVTPNNSGASYKATVTGLKKGISMVGIAVNKKPVSSVMVKYAPPSGGNSNNAAEDINNVADTINAIVSDPDHMTPTQKAVVNAAATELISLSPEAKKGLSQNAVESLDGLYQKAAGITSSKNVTNDENVENPIEENDVSIKGMALASGATSKADVKVNIKQQKPTKTQNGENAELEFEMSFTVDGTEQKLQSPLMITIPLPENIKTDGMIIKHTKSDNTIEEITYSDTLSNGHYTLSGNSATMWVNSFSTFTFMTTASKPIINGGGGSGGGNSDHNHDEYDFWEGIKEKIDDANRNDVIKVNVKSYDKMPFSVMDALRNNNVGMVITWDGGKNITIPAGKAHQSESNRIYYPLSFLAQMYKDIEIVNSTATTDSAKENPETGGLSYVDVTTGKTQPISGGIIEVAPPATIEETTPDAPIIVTPSENGFEKDDFAKVVQAEESKSINWAGALAGITMLLATLGGIYFLKKKKDDNAQNL